MSQFVDYIKDTRGELQHVTWPTKKQAIAFTILVIVISLAVASFLGFFDYILSLIIQKFVL
ncbi:MAG: preprotein translocase subunit SecE [bacterium]|nr:preprotein translocase subunit SecE [bacterium]